MKSNVVKIKFFFPKVSSKPRNKREFVDLLGKTMRKDGSIKYAGFQKERNFHKHLTQNIGGTDIKSYKPISTRQKQDIKKIISATANKCHRVLPHPNPPIFAFVYPWFPEENSRIVFGGVAAFASYLTMHIFVDLTGFTRTSLRQTVTHEWSHLVFYQYHQERKYTLSKYMLMEGLAEVFREEVVGGKPAPWALALNKKEVKKEIKLLKRHFNTKGTKIYREVFLDGKTRKRWTGYSIGYRLVKQFRKKHPRLSWEEISKIKPENIFKSFIK